MTDDVFTERSAGIEQLSVTLTVSSPAGAAGYLIKSHSLCGYMTMVLTEKYRRGHPSNDFFIEPAFGELG